MSRKPISPDLVGLTLPPVTRTWSARDAMLYALGVGARPAEDLDYVYEGRGPKVLPTYAVIPGGAAMSAVMRDVDMRLEMLLHGEQSVELFRPLPSEAEVTVTGRITEVWDKGKAAVIGIESLGRDEQGDLFRTHATLFVRGAGGFGGDRGPPTGDIAPPPREADITVPFETRPEQGAIYRLSGDLNPIHIDPDFARSGGFAAPFLHGLCTYGVVGRAILRELCHDDPTAFRAMRGRFADRVGFGDTITTRIWRDTPGRALVQAETQDGRVVLSNAEARFTE
jgi:acyl dehydratase